MAPDELPIGRRQGDDSISILEFVDERMRRVLEKGLRDSRHELRTEIAALSAQMAANNLRQATDHAKVHASLERLSEDVTELFVLKQQVNELKAIEIRQDAITGLRKTIWRAVGAGASLVVAVGGVLAALIH